MLRFRTTIKADTARCGGMLKGTWRLPMSLAVVAMAASAAVHADVVTDWDAIAARTITPPAGTVLGPAVTEAERRPVYQVDLATLHVAIYDAVNAIDGTHKPFAVSTTLPVAGASQEAAAVGAAYGVLMGLFPGRHSLYQAAYDSYIAGIGSDAAKIWGLAIGAEVANKILALRSQDGRLTAVVPYVTSGAPGDFVPSSPALVNQFLPFVKPFAIRNAAQFRAPPPPALTGEKYADDLNEVQALGSMASVLRSVEQTDLARFNTEPPPIYTPRNWRRFASDSQSIATNARLLALLWVVNADAILGCFESKYHYRFWRPRTAIPMANADDNADTVADAGWAPIVPTPNHPEYPAAHSCSHGSLAESLRQFYDTRNLNFVLDSGVSGLINPIRQFTSTNQMVKEIGEARIFGGMHFRNSTRQGAKLGERTAKWISEHFFQAVDDDDAEDRP